MKLFKHFKKQDVSAESTGVEENINNESSTEEVKTEKVSLLSKLGKVYYKAALKINEFVDRHYENSWNMYLDCKDEDDAKEITIDEDGNIVDAKTGKPLTEEEMDQYFRDTEDEDDEAYPEDLDCCDGYETCDGNCDKCECPGHDESCSEEEDDEKEDDLAQPYIVDKRTGETITEDEFLRRKEAEAQTEEVEEDPNQIKLDIDGATVTEESVEESPAPSSDSQPDESVTETADAAEEASQTSTETTKAAPEVERIKYENPVIGDLVRKLATVSNNRSFEFIESLCAEFTKENEGTISAEGDAASLKNGVPGGAVIYTVKKNAFGVSQEVVESEGTKYRNVVVSIPSISLMLVPKYDKRRLALNVCGISTDAIKDTNSETVDGYRHTFFALNGYPFDVTVIISSGAGKNTKKVTASVQFNFITEVKD